MKQHKLNGFTLMEVIVAFALLSFIVLMVGGAVTSSYVMAHKLRELPNTYYNAQGKLEEYTSLLSKIADAENRRSGYTEDELEYSVLTAELDDLEAQLSSLQESYEAEGIEITEPVLVPWNMFHDLTEDTAEDDEIYVPVYQVSEAYTIKSGANIKLYTGAVGTDLGRDVPFIDKVTIKQGDSLSTRVAYLGGTNSAYATVTYNDKNYDLLETTMYQWYVSTGKFYITESLLPNESNSEFEQQAGRLFPIYPNNYTSIVGAKSETLTIDPSYVNKVLVCVATPLSKNGAMGSSVVSNLVYVSGLPADIDCKLIIDPSLATLDDMSVINQDPNGQEYIDIYNISSLTPGSGTLTMKNGDDSVPAKLYFNGDFGRSINPENGANSFRYLKFSPDGIHASQLEATVGSGTYYVFAVVRNNVNEGSGYGTKVPFVFSGGNGNNGKEVSVETVNTWTVVASDIKVTNGKITIGRPTNISPDVDIAELIIAKGVTSEQISSITKYLETKYDLSSSQEAE